MCQVYVAINYCMKIISTWLFDPWLQGRVQSWRHTVDMLAAMRATAGLARRKYGNFTVYTDRNSEPWLREILPDCDILVGPSLAYHGVNHRFYSWGKLWTWRQQTQEFLYIDLDFLIGPAWPQQFADAMIVGQWWEPVDDVRARSFYNWQQASSDLILPEEFRDLDATAPAINTGCLLVRDIEFVQKYVDAVKNLMTVNESAFADELPITVPSLEQHVLGMMLKKYHINSDVLIQPDQKYVPVNNQFIHFLGRRWKNRDLPLTQSILARTLDSWITQELQDIAQRLNKQIP